MLIHFRLKRRRRRRRSKMFQFSIISMNECRMRVLLANSSYQPGVRYIYKREGKEFEYGKRFDGRTTKIGRIKGSNIKPANLQKTLEELKQQGFQVEQNVWQAIQAALA